MENAVSVKKVLKDGNFLKIIFSYDPDTIERVKKLEGRRWNADKKFWTAYITAENVEKLKKWDFRIDEEIEKHLQALHLPDPEKIENVEVPGLKKSLYPFQSEGVAYIESRRGRALLADEMGLGKTVQAIAWLQLHPELRPAVVVCPASLKLNWEREIKQWIDESSIQVLHGKNGKNSAVLGGKIIILNYDIVSDWTEKIAAIKPKVVVLDESHYIKNSKAQRTRAVKNLCRNIPHIIAITGTPIANRPAEMFNALNLVAPLHFPSWWVYARRYCGAEQTRFGWDFSGASNTRELNEKLKKTIMIRRLKKDVLTELPEKTRSVVPHSLDNFSEYRAAETDFISYLRSFDWAAAERAQRAEMLARIEGLKQLTIAGKIKSCIEWIEDYIESNGKLVVFATHRETIDILIEKFGTAAVKIDGSVSGEDRQKAVDEFQNNPNIKLFIGNLKAAGVGLTLTAAAGLCFLEYSFVPGDHIQAEDRIHRIGQRDSVNIYYHVAHHSIEEKLVDILHSKSQIIGQVLDGQAAEDESSLFAELISTFAEASS